MVVYPLLPTRWCVLHALAVWCYSSAMAHSGHMSLSDSVVRSSVMVISNALARSRKMMLSYNLARSALLVLLHGDDGSLYSGGSLVSVGSLPNDVTI